MLQPGEKFPAFSLADQDGQTKTNADFTNDYAVYFFYPKDDTPGCTVESCEFNVALPEIPGGQVIGISPDSSKSHRKFADKFGLKYTLLADTETTLCQACGVWVEKSMYGKKYMGVERTTFLVDPDGVVIRVWNKVKPEGHAAEVAQTIASATSSAR